VLLLALLIVLAVRYRGLPARPEQREQTAGGTVPDEE